MRKYVLARIIVLLYFHQLIIHTHLISSKCKRMLQHFYVQNITSSCGQSTTIGQEHILMNLLWAIIMHNFQNLYLVCQDKRYWPTMVSSSRVECIAASTTTYLLLFKKIIWQASYRTFHYPHNLVTYWSYSPFGNKRGKITVLQL